MEQKLVRLRQLISVFWVAAVLCCGAQAQISTFAKTSPGIADTTTAAPESVKAWTIPTLVCDNSKSSVPCQPALETRAAGALLFSNAAPINAVSIRAGLGLDAKIDVTAQTAGNLALFKIPISTDDLTKKDEDRDDEQPMAASMEKLFQLSSTVDWRIEPGEMDGKNQVGVFTSKTLSQFGPNASFKFDAGVNVEAKTGTVAGKAGFVVAW